MPLFWYPESYLNSSTLSALPDPAGIAPSGNPQNADLFFILQTHPPDIANNGAFRNYQKNAHNAAVSAHIICI